MSIDIETINMYAQRKEEGVMYAHHRIIDSTGRGNNGGGAVIISMHGRGVESQSLT
jgi:hypothetical protein